MRKRIAAAIVGAVSALSAGAAAAFAPSVSPPPGYDPGAGTYRPSAPTPVNGGRIGGGQVGVQAGGRTIYRPISFRIPPGAGKRIATGIIRGGGLGAVAGLASWAAEKCVHFQNGGLFLRCDSPDDDPFVPGELAYVSYNTGAYANNAQELCDRLAKGQTGGYYTTTGRLDSTNDADRWKCMSVPDNGNAPFSIDVVYKTYRCYGKDGKLTSYSSTGRCRLPSPDGQPITEEEAAERLSPTLPPVITPNVDVPVEAPVWNPSPSRPDRTRPVTAPVGNPVPHTERTPDGERRTVWVQPNVTITHTPREGDPLRFDVKPGQTTVTGPGVRTGEVNGQPQPDPTKPGEKPATETQTEEGEQKPEEEKDDGLCSGEDADDILACQKMGELEEMELPEREVTMTFEPDASFHRNGQCPADKTIRVGGMSATFSYRQVCEFASSVRPLFVAFAGLAAAMMIIGAGRRE